MRTVSPALYATQITSAAASFFGQAIRSEKNAVLEMESRLTGTWQDTAEDIKLRERWIEQFCAWSEFKKYHNKISDESRIGACFLRTNKKFLD